MSEPLHAAVCQAVALLNVTPEIARIPGAREAHTILRQALADYADAFMEQPATPKEREAIRRRHANKPVASDVCPHGIHFDNGCGACVPARGTKGPDHR
jgi:hypothetical protein